MTVLVERVRDRIWRNRAFWGVLIATLLMTFITDGLLIERLRTQLIGERTEQARLLTRYVAEMVALNPQDERGIRTLIQTVVRGAIHYAQVVREGAALIEARSLEATHFNLTPLNGAEPRRRIQRLDLSDGPLLDVIEPLPGLDGYVRLGFSLSSASYALMKETFSIVGISIGAWFGMVLLFAGFFWVYVGRRAKHPEETALEAATSYEPAGSALELNGLRIDDARKIVVGTDGQIIPLSPKEYRLLMLLASEPGRVFSEEEIRRKLWPDGQAMTRKDVTHYVYLLRRKLEDHAVSAELIENVRGHGYKIST